MPTQSTTYNSRVTDEALEKRFRDTFRSQGGAELVDDLYAQGVIVPVVDFTQAATGQTLAQNLQTAWDFSTGSLQSTAGGNQTFITNAGFWQIDLTCSANTSTSDRGASISLSDGLTTKKIWDFGSEATGGTTAATSSFESKFVVFVRSGDSVFVSGDANLYIAIWYRQIATVNGDLIDPSGFTSS